MNQTRAATLTAITLTIALPIATCNGNNSNSFRKNYNAAIEDLSKVNDNIDEATSDANDSNAQIAKKFDEIADTAEQTRTDLTALEPPKDTQKEFDQLLAALKKNITDLRAMADAATSNDPTATTQAVADLTESSEEITQAENALKDTIDE